VSTNVTLHAGHDVAYFTSGQHRGGCAGAMSYYTAAGEPPGEWAGKGAAALGLTRVVDPDVIEHLYQENLGPGGELLVKRRQTKKAHEREAAAVAAYLAGHPYASATEVAEVRAAARGKDPHGVPYFDLTVSAVKSVSVLHASYRISARQARQRGDHDRADAFDARADELEAALMDSAREAVAWLEQHATYTRTGHHSARSGEWRDGAGLTASLFLHHLSRDGDPQLHVHVAIWNRVQRADGADGKWRTLDSRSLHNQRLGVAPVADRILETKLSALGYVMVPRADGNGAEVGGVSQDVIELFSSRAVAVTGELDRLAAEYQAAHGRPPSRRTLWLLHQQAGQNTRRTKAQARRTIAGQTGATEPTEAQRLTAWEAQTAHREVQALSAVHEQVAAFAAARTVRAPTVLDDAAKRTAARIAVAEVQKLHAVWSMAQLRFEVHRALPVLGASIDGPAVVDEVARLAVSGRSGTEVVQVIAPDITDVTGLGVRASDGGSIYRPPNEERYCTLAHLDVEEQILTAAKQTVPQLVSSDQSRAAVDRTGLTAEQRDAMVMMLTAVTTTTVLVAPAGTGKSHTMAEFARLWTTVTGRRVIGLTTSTNAARVLAHEGLAESYNIAQFLGKTEGSDELRRPVPLHQDDVLVLDEASQLATADLAMIQESARQAGARVIATGDTAQLGAVEAGGMFRLLAREVPTAELHEVRRFDAAWERQASVRLRDGDEAAVAVYDRHGGIRGADHETACDRAASMWLADHLRGKDVLLLAGSNTEAAGLARRVQGRLTQLGTIGPPQAALADGNHAGVGDLIRARLNTEIDAGGRPLTNRDTLQVTAFRGPDAEVRRQRPDGTWTASFRVPGSYLAQNAELAYAGNVHVAQGRTVDTAHLLVTETLSRQALYVGMTRGRQANTAHVVTGTTAPPGHQPYQQATPEAVLAGILGRDDGDLSAIEQIRQAQDQSGGTGHLLTLWSAAVRQTLHLNIDEQVKARLLEHEAWRYDREHARQALHQRLCAAQLAGHDINSLIDRTTVAPMDRARSVTSVLHHRLQQLALPDLRHDATWAQRTPATAPPVAHELAATLDDRVRALSERAAASPEPWLARHLGILAPGASPALRAEYTRRAGIAAAYREAAGIINPDQAVSPEPHRGSPELEAMRKAVLTALEIRDEADIIRGLDRGELEARALQGQRARAAAPPDVSGRLRLTAQAEADALQQAAAAQARRDYLGAVNAAALAAQLTAERQCLEAGNSRYEQWSADTHATRDAAGKAVAELQGRGRAQAVSEPHRQPAGEPQLMTGWRREVEPDAEAVNCVDASEHHIVNNAGEPRPSQRIPDMNPPSVPMPEPRTSPESEPEQDDRAARLDELLARADQGAQRIVAQQAERHASSDYAARIELEAQAQAEAGQQAQARDELELELLRRSLGAGCGRACCPSGRPPVSRCRTHRPGPGSRGSPSWTRRTGPPGSPQRRESGDLVDLERAVQARRVQQPGPGRTAPVVRSADGLRLLGICGGNSSGSAWKSWIASSLAAASPVSAALKVPCFTA
jgi:conjugative relaxase-like TrwC/TraI family protein